MSRLIRVRVHPRASRDRVEPAADGGFDIWTTAAPDRGAANEAVRRLLAKTLRVSAGSITLKRGATSRIKLFEVA
ncbi:MAG: DUF167 domain-containing protein [Candidatus Sumerlaeaceae bacterium]|nr:DUF167 domain-containing protein [Candidatus Sumerlaeaceae bacterium]